MLRCLDGVGHDYHSLASIFSVGGNNRDPDKVKDRFRHLKSDTKKAYLKVIQPRSGGGSPY